MDPIYFVPITKVDVEKREVWGRAVQEVPDKSKEIFDYATSAPLFRDWSEGFDKATDGKSLGNIRAMHGKVAAGKVTAIDFNDKELAIDICAKVVDDAEWEKCTEGVYTGFSIGGSYEKRWADGDLKRYTARPAEISLVDNPCVPTARFQMIKADGQIEEKEFKAPAPDPAAAEAEKVAARSDTSPKEGEDKYGDVAFADPKNKKYPIDTEEHIRAAWNYINKPKNADKYSSGDVSSIKDRIVAAWKKKIDKDGPPSADKAAEASLQKGLYLQILDAMTAEESAELVEELTPDGAIEVIELADKGNLKKFLAKAGARHSAADKKHLQGIHDHSVAMGADCSAGKAAASDDLAKITVDIAELDTVKQSLAKATVDLSKVTSERDAFEKRVKELEAEPAAPKGVSKVIGKEADTVDATKKDETEDKTPLGLMKKAQSKPQLLVKN